MTSTDVCGDTGKRTICQSENLFVFQSIYCLAVSSDDKLSLFTAE